MSCHQPNFLLVWQHKVGVAILNIWRNTVRRHILQCAVQNIFFFLRKSDFFRRRIYHYKIRYYGGRAACNLTKKGFNFCLEFREIWGGIRYLGFLMRKKKRQWDEDVHVRSAQKKSSISIFWHAKPGVQNFGVPVVAATLISRKITPMLIIHTSANWTHVIKGSGGRRNFWRMWKKPQ